MAKSEQQQALRELQRSVDGLLHLATWQLAVIRDLSLKLATAGEAADDGAGVATAKLRGKPARTAKAAAVGGRGRRERPIADFADQ